MKQFVERLGLKHPKGRAAAGGVIILVAFLLACGGGSQPDEEQPSVEVATSQSNTDPRKGEVDLDELEMNDTETVTKKCDGTTLVYIFRGFGSAGLDVIENSAECQPNETTSEPVPLSTD